MTIENFTIFIILGATGDLVDKKIIPAMYSLFIKGLITEKSIKIIAFARRDFNDGKYKEIIDHSLSTYAMVNLKSVNLEPFYSLFDYHQGQFDKKEDFITLANKINVIQDSKNLCADKIFYMAVPTDLYDDVISHIVDTQLQDMCSKKSDIFSQLIIEKPFGSDLQTSMKLDSQLKTLFKEEQIYRIDHYLGKEIIREVINFRKSNFLNKWNKDFIKSVSISTAEELGVEKRGAFFDSVGCLVDVGQNHLVEMMAILTMDLHEGIDFNYQTERAKAMSKIKVFNDEEIKKYTYRAQYEGYRTIENVKPNSMMETYFKVVAFLTDPKWEGVPFFLESGKRTGTTKKEMIVEFKDGEKVTFDFVKDPKIIINNKEGGQTFVNLHNLEKQDLQYVGEYATLFREALKRKRENFVSIAEIEAAWKYIDPIRQAWNNNLVPLDSYKPDDSSILSKAKFDL